MTITQAPLRAYFGNPALKAKFVARMEAHIEADQLAQGAVGQGGLGCAVWCTYDEYDHSLGPRRLGVPEWFERLRDGVFEGLPADEAQAWALSSLVEVPVGADVDSIRRPFLVRMLRRRLDALSADARQERTVVRRVIDWLEAGGPEPERPRLGSAAEAEAAADAAEAAWLARSAEAADAADAEARWARAASEAAATWWAVAMAKAAADAVAEAAEAAATAAEAEAWADPEAAEVQAAHWRERRSQRDDLVELLRGLEAA